MWIALSITIAMVLAGIVYIIYDEINMDDIEQDKKAKQEYLDNMDFPY